MMLENIVCIHHFVVIINPSYVFVGIFASASLLVHLRNAEKIDIFSKKNLNEFIFVHT